VSEVVLLPAGVVVGVINAIAGGGSLLSFPLFLALGYSPVSANVTNTVGIFACNFSASWGYRRELRKVAPTALSLCLAATLGSIIGASILLTVGSDAFGALVPWLMFGAVALVAVQPTLVRVLRGQRDAPVHRNWAVLAAFAAGLYGGYFGAAVGILLLALLGICLHATAQRTNALKNLLALCINAIDVVIFAAFGPVHWGAAGLLALGTTTGGYLGASIAQRVPDQAFRYVVVGVGVAAGIAMLISG
jgi:uncharacterized membrane protein YfcA